MVVSESVEQLEEEKQDKKVQEAVRKNRNSRAGINNKGNDKGNNFQV